MKIQLLCLGLLSLLLLTACNQDERNPLPEPAPVVNTGNKITILSDEFESRPLVIAGSEGWNFIVSFHRELNGEELAFTAVDDQLPIIMKDQNGTEWDWLGRGVSGPGQGQQLQPTRSMMGFWFAFGALYPGAAIYEGPSRFEELPLPNDPNWLIPTKRLVRATGLDAIQSIQEPELLRFDEEQYPAGSFYLKDNDLVIGFAAGEAWRAYPHAILNWHEIVNDELGGEAIAVVYCPLTGTATIWDRQLAGGLTTFGVSGLLYNSNILPFDRQTESFWTQLDGRCVNGTLKGSKTPQHPLVETSWSTWKTAFPNAEVMADKQRDIDRDYREYPYGDYLSNHQYIAYPLELNDDRLPAKERVHGVIINSKIKVYRFEHLSQ